MDAFADILRVANDKVIELDAVIAERDQLRMENHRMRTEIAAFDLHHIRLRDGMRTALAAWAEAKPIMTDEEYAEWQRLNAYVTP